MASKRYLLYISQNYSFTILRPLQKAILARGDKVAWFIEGSQLNRSYFDKDERVLESIQAVIEYNAIATFFPQSIAPTFLPGLNVSVFHGFNAGKVDKKGNNDHFKIRNCFDLYCTQGPDTTAGFKSLTGSNEHFKVIETGWCALDGMYLEKNKQDVCETERKKTILLCSTFSKKLSCAPHLFETIKKLSMTGKWKWLVQFHPKMPLEIVERYKGIQGEYLTFVETDDVVPLLQEADVMVCDTSSVLLMFLLLNKPVVTFNNIDPKEYLLNINDEGLLESSIETALSHPAELMKSIQKFVEQNHPYSDGKSSVRVLEAVEYLIENPLPKKKPVDLIRQLKMRKRLNYWAF